MSPDQELPACPDINSLPEGILMKCLESLSHKYRLISAALVCRRWRNACASPELLREVTLVAAAQDLRTRPPLAALLRWLLRHGAAVHSLTVQLNIRAFYQQTEAITGEQAPEINSVVDSCIAAGGSLEQLVFACVPGIQFPNRFCYSLGSWAAAARTLRQLSLYGMFRVYCHATLEGLRSLESLTFGTSETKFLASVGLPTSLTKLCLSYQHQESAPHQFGALCNLHSLEIKSVF